MNDKEFLLAMLRAASLRAKLMDAEITAIGVALRGGFIEPAAAVQWLHDEGLMFLVGGPVTDGSMASIAVAAAQGASEVSEASNDAA